MQLTPIVSVRVSQVKRGAPRWKSLSGAASAIILSLLFLASGIWKLTDLDAAAQRMVQSLVPVGLSMPAALAVAAGETLAGVMLLLPRSRRWGAWLAGLMLVLFMLYIGVFYNRLLGEDCNCFPWIQRVVGPAFFAGDAAMLALAGLAGWGSSQPQDGARAAIALGCVCLAAGGAYLLAASRRNHAVVPETVMVDGRRLALHRGRFLLYFFDPECSHCFSVAQEMARKDWGTTRIVVLATREQRFASSFLTDTRLRAGISPDSDTLRKALPFTDPPYAVAVDQGRVVAMFNSGQMEDAEYYATLQRLGFLKGETQ